MLADFFEKLFDREIVLPITRPSKLERYQTERIN
jgi:hypothetical protein